MPDLDCINLAEKQLNAQLNYGGMLQNGELRSDRITMGWRGGDLESEIGQMRRLAEAFSNLADALDSGESK